MDKLTISDGGKYEMPSRQRSKSPDNYDMEDFVPNMPQTGFLTNQLNPVSNMGG